MFKQHKIIAISQIRNELRKGNLQRFFKYLLPHVDGVVILDDFSTDGSYEYCLSRAKTVIRGTRNNFVNERKQRQVLLEAALLLEPDFILSIDADEVIACGDNLNSLQDLANWVIEKNLDGACLREINLWRSKTWERVDSDFGSVWFPRFWRVVGDLKYDNLETGLHQSPAPECIKNVKKYSSLPLLHYGFADDRNISFKYLNYGRFGQKGINLSRLIDEGREFKLSLVDEKFFPNELWHKGEACPTKRDPVEWLSVVNNFREEALRPSISIISLIYKSTDWLDFVYSQVKKYCDLSDKEFFFIANDASDEVISHLENNYIPYYKLQSSTEQKKEWYINNVYRAWNYAAQKAKGDYILFINSDMAFSPSWLELLIAGLTGKNCVSPRLVESGKMATGGINIEKNFGFLISEYDESGFLSFVQKIKENRIVDNGAFMPLLINRNDFIEAGGYPEGNVRRGSGIERPIIAKRNEDFISGDVILMERLKKRGISHQTVFSSVAYHFQEGEMTCSETPTSKRNIKILLANNSLKGAMGEKTMWNFLLEGLPNCAGIDMELVGARDDRDFAAKADNYIENNFPEAKIVIQNASFIDILSSKLRTVVFLQDDLRRMGKIDYQQEKNLETASFRVSNTNYTASSYLEYPFSVIPLGIDQRIFYPRNKSDVRKYYGISQEAKVGIFVGDLTETKGWSEIRDVVTKRQDILWIIVSKGIETYHSPNVLMFNRVNQETLAKLYSAADFFIIGSRVETQCLVAMESCLCNTPVVMRPIGFFSDLTQEERDLCGIITNDIFGGVDKIFFKNFFPRRVMIDKDVSINAMLRHWKSFISDIILKEELCNPVCVTGPKNHAAIMLFGRKFWLVITNKNYLNVFIRKKLPPCLYGSILSVWRLIKKLKIL